MRSSKERVGELFISGFSGESPTEKVLHQIDTQSLGGVVLFAENCTDHDRLRHSIEKLQTHSDKPLFIAIDQEGGRVCRLKGKPAEYLSAESYGEKAGQGPEGLQEALESYQTDFELAAAYMSELGINLLLGPVCDLRPQLKTKDESTALNERTFGSDPMIVGAFAKLTVALAQKHNLLCCLKHAPGLGSVRVDPHFTLGASALSVDELRERDLAPFREGYAAGARMVMTSHFLIPDSDTLPVTFSKTTVDALIRNELHPDVTLITDDMDMGALNDFGGVENSCLTALNAGHDILLARSNDTVADGIAAIQQGLDTGIVSEEGLLVALRRIDALRNTLERVT